ncbi:ABC transporter substrate-binding protein [Paraburkholderia panacisoli]|uniref:ABC transporter substrate-binding protein n=1 Tax=Paraburkholderia panacisoli TaxID=2603818 RepID=A0A5B0GL01_9BURK|nr:ABC transporter substrate-binding protein [Paraburkholderia panacisoli]KAA1004117.1 ABC transporter substrate-binding protein [Paraburkholderia panacisoli]
MSVPLLAMAAQDKVTIGFITDMSGLYADKEGKNGALTVQMAIDDFGGNVNGMPVELLTADHQNKADIAATKAREWIDTRNLTMLLGGTNSAADLAMSRIARDKKRVFITSGGTVSTLTNEECSPYTVQYDIDTVGMAKGIATAVLDQGNKRWYFLTADYAFGNSLQSDASKVIASKGGTVIGSVRHPLNASDFSSYLLQAQASKAQVLALADAGGDFINAAKAAKEFSIGKSMKIVGMLVFNDDIHSLGLQNTEGLLLTATWDWNLDEKTRAFGKRFYAKTGRMPTSVQAADYSATTTYLKAVQATKSTDADAIMAYLKKTPIDDFYAHGVIRVDGRFVHDMYLLQVKSPAESKAPWDYFQVISRLKGEDIATTKSESRCVLWH